MVTMNVNLLAQAWLEAKAQEKEANARRVELEQLIIDMVGTKPESTLTTETDKYVIKTTDKITRTLDQDSLTEEYEELSECVKNAIRTKFELDLKAYRKLSDDALEEIDEYITAKPAKTAVSVTLKE